MDTEKKSWAITPKKLAHLAARISFLIAVMFLAVYLITVLTTSGDFFKATAEKSALLSLDDDLVRAEALAKTHYDYLYEVVADLQYAQSTEEVRAVAEKYHGRSYFGDLRFFAGNNMYSAEWLLIEPLPEGNEKDSNGNEIVRALSQSREKACSVPYFDAGVGKECIAFFIPVRGSAYVDGVASIVEARNIINIGGVKNDVSTATLLVDRNQENKVLGDSVKDGFEAVGPDFPKFIIKTTNGNAEMLNTVMKEFAKGEKTACTISKNSTQYTIAMAPMEAFDEKLMLLTMTESELLINDEMVYIYHIVNLSIIAIVAIAIGGIYALFYYRGMKHALDVASYTDPMVGCPNAEQFRASSSAALREGGRRYAVAVFEIRQFRYLSETQSEKDMTELLKLIAKVIETFCDPREHYGYLGDGRFGLLITYEEDRSISDRVRLVEAVINKNGTLGAGKSKRHFNVGVCLVTDPRRTGMPELIDHARIAAERAKNDVNAPFVIFSEQVSAERERNDRIEAEMEAALTNNEFRLFLQPKYNIAQDRMDSAEALVRWFDPKTGDYRFPGEFISLFESNGFITKLDHFMYLEVLKCLSSAAEKGEKVVPISVNVSLVTASAKDFLPFYIENKKKYRVPDGFITVELTESFAMNDSQKLREIVDALHASGIRCSLDDFGTGYASFGVLKNIPLDELKLDRMFLGSGIDKKNDETLLATVISLAKSLGMSVVQEGVETREMFERVVEKGCDVIQGYYYAKAIPLEEYKLFINSNTSIKYKSLVK